MSGDRWTSSSRPPCMNHRHCSIISLGQSVMPTGGSGVLAVLLGSGAPFVEPCPAFYGRGTRQGSDRLVNRSGRSLLLVLVTPAALARAGPSPHGIRASLSPEKMR